MSCQKQQSKNVILNRLSNHQHYQVGRSQPKRPTCGRVGRLTLWGESWWRRSTSGPLAEPKNGSNKRTRAERSGGGVNGPFKGPVDGVAKPSGYLLNPQSTWGTLLIMFMFQCFFVFEWMAADVLTSKPPWESVLLSFELTIAASDMKQEKHIKFIKSSEPRPKSNREPSWTIFADSFF